MRTRVYIAGPLSLGDRAENIRQASEAFFALMRAGYAPFCPHWSAYSRGPYAAPTLEHLPDGTTHDDWMGVDLPWVSVADAVLRLPGESKGADLECETAAICGIPIFYSVDALTSSLRPKRSQLPPSVVLLNETVVATAADCANLAESMDDPNRQSHDVPPPADVADAIRDRYQLPRGS